MLTASNSCVSLSAFSTHDLLNELIKRNPFLDREQTARYLDIEPNTLAARDSRRSHKLRRYKFGPNGRVKYRFLDIEQHIRDQQIPD